MGKTTIAGLELQVKNLSFKVEALQRTDNVFRRNFERVEEAIGNLELSVFETVGGKISDSAMFAGRKVKSGAGFISAHTPRVSRVDGGLRIGLPE